MFKWFKILYWKWQLRHVDENICCCGDKMGSYCSLGFCKSMKDHAMENKLKEQTK